MNACLLSQELKQKVKQLEDTISSQQATIDSQQATIDSQQATIDFLRAKINSQQATINSLQATIYSMQMGKLKLYIGNMLVDFIEKIYRKRGQSLPPGAGNDPSHSTTRHAQAAQQIGQKNLKDLDIPVKYYDALQRFSEVYNPIPGLRARIT